MRLLKAILLRPPLGVLAFLAAVAYVFYFPIIPVYFSTDDYNFIGGLLRHGREYVQGEQLYDWFILFSAQGLQNPDLSIFFRPGVHWLWLLDYIMWGTFAPAYHLTNVSLHALNAFLVYLLAFRILRHRAAALVAGLLFALHPVHVTAVALVSNHVDLLSAFFYLLSALYFVLYRERDKNLYYFLSVLFFFAGVVTKESTVALPALLFAYDILFTFYTSFRFTVKPDARGISRAAIQIARAQIPYWIALAVYVLLRLRAFGEFGRNTGGGFLSYGVELFFQFYTMALAQPFFSDMSTGLLLAVLGLAVVVIAIYRERRALWFGLAWIAVALLPATATANVAPRIAYTPSAGLPIALAAIIVQPFLRKTRASRAATIVLTGFVLVAYGIGISAQVDDWRAVGSLAGAVKEETQRLYPALPDGARLYYVGVPEILRAIYIYNNNFVAAIQLFYRNPTLSAERVEKFPILTDDLTTTHFFEFRRRTLAERADLLRALESRKHCLTSATPAIVWDFSREAQGWEAWNQLAPFEHREGALVTRALDTDAFMGSPLFEIAAAQIGNIEIEMRVRADAPVKGAIYWLRDGQADFVPNETRIFDVQPDDRWHTYRVDLAESGRLAFGDQVVRLRVDPTDQPAEIALKTIRVTRWCNQNDAGSCQCTP